MEPIAEVLTWVIILGAIGLYVWAIVICFQKGKPIFGLLGIASVALIFVSWLPVAGALRLALPSSKWARSRYDHDKMRRAAARFPKDAAQLITADPTAIPGLTIEQLPFSRQNLATPILAGAAAVVVVAGVIVFAAVSLGEEINALAAGREEVESGQEEEVISAWAITPGDCINFPPEDMVETIERVNCEAPHDAEAYAIFNIAGTTYPGESAIDDAAVDGCLARFHPFVGVAYEYSELDVFWLEPTEESWNDNDDREIVCMIATADGTQLTRSMKSSSV